jgi:hypothetical protein
MDFGPKNWLTLYLQLLDQGIENHNATPLGQPPIDPKVKIHRLRLKTKRFDKDAELQAKLKIHLNTM